MKRRRPPLPPALEPRRPSESLPAIAWRYKKRAIVLFVLVAAGALFWNAGLPRGYRARATLAIRSGAVPQPVQTVSTRLVEPGTAESVVEDLGPGVVLGKAWPEATDQADGADEARDWKSSAQRHVAVVWSTVHEAVPGTWQTALGWRAEDDEEQAAAILAQSLRVRPGGRGDRVVLSCEAGSPAGAEAVLASLVARYQGLRAAETQPAKTPLRPTVEAEQLGRELADAERATREAERAATGPRAAALAERIVRLDEDRAKKQAAASGSEAKLRTLREAIAKQEGAARPPVDPPAVSPELDRLRAELAECERQEQAAAEKYTEAHPLMQEAQRQTAAARQALEHAQAAQTSPPSPGAAPTAAETLQAAVVLEESNLAALRAEAAALDSQLAELRRQQQIAAQAEARAAALRQDVERLRAAVAAVPAPVATASTLAEIEIVEPPRAEPSPVRPATALHLALGLLLAAGVSLGAIALAHRRDRTLRTPFQVQAGLGLPVMAEVPRWRRRVLRMGEN